MENSIRIYLNVEFKSNSTSNLIEMLSNTVKQKVKDEKLKKSQHMFIIGQKIYYGAGTRYKFV